MLTNTMGCEYAKYKKLEEFDNLDLQTLIDNGEYNIFENLVEEYPNILTDMIIIKKRRSLFDIIGKVSTNNKKTILEYILGLNKFDDNTKNVMEGIIKKHKIGIYYCYRCLLEIIKSEENKKKTIIFIKLINSNRFNVNYTDNDGRMLLHYSCLYNRPDISKIIMRLVKNVNKKDKYEMTPMMMCGKWISNMKRNEVLDKDINDNCENIKILIKNMENCVEKDNDMKDVVDYIMESKLINKDYYSLMIYIIETHAKYQTKRYVDFFVNNYCKEYFEEYVKYLILCGFDCILIKKIMELKKCDKNELSRIEKIYKEYTTRN